MHKFSFLILILISNLSFGQGTYWQQKVDHTIDVTLDDESHILRAYQEMNYVNKSPDTLKYIFIHVWPNAYKNDRTPFAKQKVESGDTKFYFASKNDRGFIDSMSYQVNGLPVNVNTYNNQEDILLLELVSPLLPGDSVNISTPFRVVIPKNFSRLGHEEQTYQITQWYPKPAVYDKDGWHPMSYLDQGEFYNEFGSYNVTITLPANYVVASTGDVQTESEKAFRKTRIVSNTDEVQKVSGNSTNNQRPKSKTIQFIQHNVHDFAWFADKSFLIEKTNFELPSGKKCEALSYFTPNNYKKYQGSSKVLAETAIYLSKHVGEYPYKHISVVDGPLYAGGGMEYPNIAIIGKMPSKSSLNTVIVHEAGHNWFQGLLASNERVHPWLDEGVNSFYEKNIELHLSEKGMDIDTDGGNDLVYILNGADHKDQPIELTSEAYSDWNYGGVVYAKAAKSIDYLEQYVGEENWEKAMKAYFDAWVFKHPSPSDFRYFVEKFTTADVRWYFEELQKSDQPIDFRITSVRQEGNLMKVSAENRFKGKYPIPVYAMNKDKIVAKDWAYDEPASFQLNDEITHFMIDAEGIVPDINQGNNKYQSNGLFKRGTPKIALGSGMGAKNYRKIYVTPAIGYNHYDKTMLGATIHNISIPNQSFQYLLAPLYSFKSKSLNGTGLIAYHFFPSSTFRKVTLSVQGSSFHNDQSTLNVSNPVYTRHYKIQPRIRLELPIENLRKKITRAIELSYFYTATQSIGFNNNNSDSVPKPFLLAYEPLQFARVNYLHKNARTFNPFSYLAQLEGNTQWAKLSAEGQLRIDYFMKDKAMHIRMFAGKFYYLDNAINRYELRRYNLNTTVTAENDYGYENYFPGRTEFEGWKSQQVMNREGGFVTRTTKLSSPLGRSDNWLLALNLRSDLPLKYKILPQIFFNAATFSDADQLNPSGSKMLFEGGLCFNFYKDLVRVSLPLILSEDLKQYTQSLYTKNRIPQQISFSINTHLLDFSRTQSLTNILLQ